MSEDAASVAAAGSAKKTRGPEWADASDAVVRTLKALIELACHTVLIAFALFAFWLIQWFIDLLWPETAENWITIGQMPIGPESICRAADLVLLCILAFLAVPKCVIVILGKAK